ncbi:hypothetical protein [Inquilinus sp. CAU 1745]|uniref:L-fucose/L-arabinose isomerase family protein n=1 Tax=Inquilinus sp. CAU 1745 TaxID=3140369 RepID=UPI00325BC0A4
MTDRRRIGVAALARATFDVPFAEETARGAFAALRALDVDLVGPEHLLFDADTAQDAIESLRAEKLDALILLQVTFTDAATAVALADAIDAPLLLWAFPEERTGGRLRLNALCGINLAAHALRKRGRACGYVYASPEAAGPDLLRALDTLPSEPSPPRLDPAPDGSREAEEIVARLGTMRLGVVGGRPEGFETCAYDPETLRRLTGVIAESVELPTIFASARSAETSRIAEARTRAEADLAELDTVEQEPLEKSLRTYAALSDLARSRRFDGLAVRCWPEFFTDYGCAACGAMAMLNQDRIPCACEADVYGDVTNLILQQLTDDPVFMADLVDADAESDSAVFWHCGLAPVSMADPRERPRATVHSNRRKPLLGEFALKPGRITIARLSQAGNVPRMVIGGGEMLSAPKSFGGTSGVARFDRPVGQVLDAIMSEGLEHHYSLTYGDHRAALAAVAGRLGLPVQILA